MTKPETLFRSIFYGPVSSAISDRDVYRWCWEIHPLGRVPVSSGWQHTKELAETAASMAIEELER